jgi:hypothetical protein
MPHPGVDIPQDSPAQKPKGPINFRLGAVNFSFGRGGALDKATQAEPTNPFAGLFGANGGGGGGGGGGGSGKKFALRDLALQREELLRQRGAGLRDIEQARVEGLRSAVNNSLQRGVFDSGIRKGNEERVTRESGEAAGDLRERIRIALEQLKNREGQVNAGGGGGGGGGGGFSGFDEELFNRLQGQIDAFGVQDPNVNQPQRTVTKTSPSGRVTVNNQPRPRRFQQGSQGARFGFRG